MNEHEILDTYTALMNKFESKCKKFDGACAVEIIRDALKSEGFNVSEKDVYILDIPIEIDLLIARQGASPERRILYRPEDVMVALEIKSRGVFGEQALMGIAENFKKIKNKSMSIECIYVTISDRENYKWKATEENINAPAYTLFWNSGPEDKMEFSATGDWKLFIEKLRKIENAS